MQYNNAIQQLQGVEFTLVQSSTIENGVVESSKVLCTVVQSRIVQYCKVLFTIVQSSTSTVL